MEPLISARLKDQGRVFYPGETLECEFQVDAVPLDDIHAVESSIMWYTEGKGDEDLAVHYFERRVRADAEDGDLRALRRFQSVLPNTPLTYQGRILNVRWCVRIRVFLKKGKEIFFELPFQLGDAPPAEELSAKSGKTAPATDESSADDGE